LGLFFRLTNDTRRAPGNTERRQVQSTYVGRRALDSWTQVAFPRWEPRDPGVRAPGVSRTCAAWPIGDAGVRRGRGSRASLGRPCAFAADVLC